MSKYKPLPPHPLAMTRDEIAEVVETAARRYQLTVHNVLGPRRFTAEVWARHEIINKLRGRGEALKRIGSVLNMDHSSVLYHLRGSRAKRCRCMVDLPESHSA